MKKMIKNILIFLFIIGVGVPTFFYLFQDMILFNPQSISRQRLDHIRNNYPHVEEVSITTPDGTELHGWFVKSDVEKAPLLIYFGGNAEEISFNIETSHLLEGWSMVLINYRGYGFSQGKPGEEELLEDALHIYEYITQREDVDKDRIVAMGRSLGSGVAVHLANERPLTGVILITPYDSIKNVAKENFPFLPVSLLLKHSFDSVSLAPNIKVPMLALTAGEDRIISAKHSQNIVDLWAGSTVHQVIKGEGHNTLQERELYWKSIKEFLKSL